MRESENDYLNNKTPRNPKLGIADVMVSTSYIICAAIWFKDGKKHEHQPRNVDEGFVVCGRRHHNVYLTVADIKDVPYKDYGYSEHVQGFLTSDDIFVDRKEGGQIAFKAGQTDKLKECLFSEDLY
jgi:hypothetical protein